MVIIIDTGCSPEIVSSCYTTFVPYCNANIDVDSLYQARHFQEVYYAPEPAPQIEYVRHRLPDPPADVIDRVVVVPQPKKYIYQVVEIPSKPPPIIQDRVVHQPPNAPICGGTYKVQVPSGSSSSGPKLIQSTSTGRIGPSIVSSSSSFVHNMPTIVQSSPVIYSS